MRAIEARLRPHLDENSASLWLEKWLQIHAGGHPTVFFSLYRLLRTRQDLTRAVTPETLHAEPRVPSERRALYQDAQRIKQNLSFVISPLFVRSRGFVRSLVCAAANTSCGHRSKYSDSGLRKLNASATRYEGGTDILLVHRRFPLLPAVV
jgi:hypothetical protein